MPELPSQSSNDPSQGFEGTQDAGVPAMQRQAESAASQAEEIVVEISSLAGMTTPTWGFYALMREKLMEAGVPVRTTCDLYALPEVTRGTLSWRHHPIKDCIIYRWTP